MSFYCAIKDYQKSPQKVHVDYSETEIPGRTDVLNNMMFLDLIDSSALKKVIIDGRDF